jgi:large subunit ribosomal protein L24
MQKIKKGDDVIVITGRDKGKRGKVQAVVGDRIAIDGINIIKKHQKPIPSKNIEGGIIEKPAFLHVSNVAVLNPTTNAQDRIGFRLLEDGVKVRIYKSTKEVVA